MIAGPGNAWVTEAKRQVAGTVGIDGLAGPSDVVVVAGDDARAADAVVSTCSPRPSTGRARWP